jgi:hypothetical protein
MSQSVCKLLSLRPADYFMGPEFPESLYRNLV